jgi:hypothetical protein
MIALAHPCSVATLLGQFERRLEKVHEKPHGRVEPHQRRCGFQALESTITHDSTNDRAILLLDKRLIIFAIGPATREHHTHRLTIIRARSHS